MYKDWTLYEVLLVFEGHTEGTSIACVIHLIHFNRLLQLSRLSKKKKKLCNYWKQLTFPLQKKCRHSNTVMLCSHFSLHSTDDAILASATYFCMRFDMYLQLMFHKFFIQYEEKFYVSYCSIGTFKHSINMYNFLIHVVHQPISSTVCRSLSHTFSVQILPFSGSVQV